MSITFQSYAVTIADKFLGLTWVILKYKIRITFTKIKEAGVELVNLPGGINRRLRETTKLKGSQRNSQT